jgi:thiamine-phosphate pyrophosphorylase
MLPVPNPSIYRILDASINRASEGLRVVEDYVRMSLNDAHLTQQLKQLRHQLIEATGGIDQEKLIAARDTQHDVGTAAATNSEYDRKTEAGIVQSNMSRLQQSLRTIEEYSKTIAAETARQIEQIRYLSYTLEKAIVTTMMSLRNLGDARICVLIDARDDVRTFARRVAQLIESGADLIQLRDKHQEARNLVLYGKRLSELTKGTATRWIMNDRADLAMAADADGVHVGQTDLAVGDVRRIVGAAKIIGVSTHNIQQARQAVLDGANYLGVGPVFFSKTKSFDSIAGLDFVRQVSSEIQLPAFAIGGVTLSNVAEIVQHGLHRVAITEFVRTAADPAKAIQQLRDALR